MDAILEVAILFNWKMPPPQWHEDLEGQAVAVTLANAAPFRKTRAGDFGPPALSSGAASQCGSKASKGDRRRIGRVDYGNGGVLGTE